MCTYTNKALYRKGFIASPNYPNNYSPNVQCQCNITTDENQKILLQFADYHLEWSQDCDKDIVQVRNPSLANVAQNRKYMQLVKQMKQMEHLESGYTITILQLLSSS